VMEVIVSLVQTLVQKNRKRKQEKEKKRGTETGLEKDFVRVQLSTCFFLFHIPISQTDRVRE